MTETGLEDFVWEERVIDGMTVSVPVLPYCFGHHPETGFTRRADGVWVKPCCMKPTETWVKACTLPCGCEKSVVSSTGEHQTGCRVRCTPSQRFSR